MEDGVTGFLLEPRSITAISEAMDWCLASADRLKEMSFAARARALAWSSQEFEAEQIWRETIMQRQYRQPDGNG